MKIIIIMKILIMKIYHEKIQIISKVLMIKNNVNENINMIDDYNNEINNNNENKKNSDDNKQLKQL